MGTESKDSITSMIAKDMLSIYNRRIEVKNTISDNLEILQQYLRGLAAQVPQSAPGPLIPKTPKIFKKKGPIQIETIPENEVVNTTMSQPQSRDVIIKVEVGEIEDSVGRSRRQASMKAAENIKRQQSLSLGTKLRRPSHFDEPQTQSRKSKKPKLNSKRKKHTGSSSEEDNDRGPLKHSRTEDNGSDNDNDKDIGSIDSSMVLGKTRLLEEEDKPEINRKLKESEMVKKNSLTACLSVVLERIDKTPTLLRNSNSRSTTKRLSHAEEEEKVTRNSIITDETVIAPLSNDIEEPSMYEDALSKPTPIMNSTMNFNSTVTLPKINATVVLEPLGGTKLNETVTIKHRNSQKNKIGENRSQKTEQNAMGQESNSKALTDPREKLRSPNPLQDRMQQLKTAMQPEELDDLLTDDESSPEIKKSKRLNKKQDDKRKRRYQQLSDSSSESETCALPSKILRENKIKTVQEPKTTYKSKALFSPYVPESVRKRVEAFEQVGSCSPKPDDDVDAPTRVTRTKTRARAAALRAAEADIEPAEKDKALAQKLARKSLAKAKKISLAKQAKDADDYKENLLQSAQKQDRILFNEKLQKQHQHQYQYQQQQQQQYQHQHQQKTTPLGKLKTQVPMSVNRIQQTPSNGQFPLNQAKALSAARSNIVTHVDSFLQSAKIASKLNSQEKAEEKKRKANEDDARKKREEALRVQTEEKRRKRQEKELKNRLAREAKEKLELEKRQKAEREKEERARLAQQMQEKQREEAERKRLLQVQRAQEKEERRRLEEQQRLLRLQEQEEAERLLAEQKQREQEAERRKEAEAKALQQAAIAAIKLKQPLLPAQTKQTQPNSKQQNAGPTNYILDSEPDEDESDDETSPKHAVPQWAQGVERRKQLEMQRYVPMYAINKFFDAKKSTIDLTEFFHGIDRSRLKRTSSAIWKSPPRYSMME